MKENTRKLVMTALFAALACVATMIIKIPTPGTGGYIHPGDAIVILSGVTLGPLYGFLAAGIGSAMADLLGGYFIYVPITFMIKGLIAFCCAHACRLLVKKSHTMRLVCCGLIDMLLVAGGYFLCEVFLYSAPAALASVPANLIQGLGGLVIAVILYPVLSAVPEIKRLMAGNNPAA